MANKKRTQNKRNKRSGKKQRRRTAAKQRGGVKTVSANTRHDPNYVPLNAPPKKNTWGSSNTDGSNYNMRDESYSAVEAEGVTMDSHRAEEERLYQERLAKAIKK